MYIRRDVIREAATATRNQTYKLDLPDKGQLCSILLRMSAEGVSDLLYATGGKWRLQDYFKKIAVMANGTSAIKSLTGWQLQASNWYDQGVFGLNRTRNYSTGSQWVYLLINFGRYFCDPDMGLDLSPFDNVQLQIENDATSSQFGQDIATTVIGYFKEEDAGFPLGYMKSEEFKSWVTVRNEWKYTDLPTEGKLRRILLQVLPELDSNNIFKTDPANLGDDIQLMHETGNVQIYRGGIDDIVRENYFDYGKPVFTHQQVNMAADKGFYTGVGRVEGRMGISGARDGGVSSNVPTVEGDRSDNTQKLEDRETGSPVEYTVMGAMPNNCLSLRFDQHTDPTRWLDLRGKGTVQLHVHTRDHADADDGTIAVVLERQELQL